MATLGENIKKHRLQRKMTTVDLAKLANVSQSTISEIENDNRSPNLDTLESICKALGVTVLDILPLPFLLNPHESVSKDSIEIVHQIERLTEEQRASLLNFLKTITNR